MVARTFVTWNFRNETFITLYIDESPAMYPGSLLSHSGHIFGSIPIITGNLHHTIIAYIYDRLGLGSDCLIGLDSVRLEFG